LPQQSPISQLIQQLKAEARVGVTGIKDKSAKRDMEKRRHPRIRAGRLLLAKQNGITAGYWDMAHNLVRLGGRP